MRTAHGSCRGSGRRTRQPEGRSPGGPRIDTRLVAAVQTRAGARIHEAAGLLNGYYLWSRLLERAERSRDLGVARTALVQVREAKTRLRRFLVAEPALLADPLPRRSIT